MNSRELHNRAAATGMWAMMDPDGKRTSQQLRDPSAPRGLYDAREHALNPALVPVFQPPPATVDDPSDVPEAESWTGAEHAP